MTVKGFLAFVGVWTTGCVIQTHVLQMDSDVLVMSWGADVFMVGSLVQDWIEGE